MTPPQESIRQICPDCPAHKLIEQLKAIKTRSVPQMELTCPKDNTTHTAALHKAESGDTLTVTYCGREQVKS